MKSSYIATAAASGIALALVLAAPPTLGEDKARPAQIPSAQSGQDRPLGDAPAADSQVAPMSANPSLGQVKPAETMEGMRAEDIVGTRIVDDSGDEIAEVKGIVRGKGTGTLHALVSVGGILGLGGKEVTIPLSAVELSGSRLISPLASTAEQLKAQPAYEASFYEAAPDEQKVKIGAVDAGAQPGAAQEAAAPFGTLDADRDGFLSMEEAKQSKELTDRWDSADRNRDNRLDQAEFAAFETADPMSPADGADAPGQSPHGAGAAAPGDVQHRGGERGGLSY